MFQNLDNLVNSTGEYWYNKTKPVGRLVKDFVDISPAGILYHDITGSTNVGLNDVYNTAGKTNLGATIEHQFSQYEQDVKDVTKDVVDVGKVILIVVLAAGGYLIYEAWEHRSAIYSTATSAVKTGVRLATAEITIPANVVNNII